MCSADIVIFKDVFMQDIIQMLFIENDHMVKTFSAKRTNNSFAKRILPWTSRCSWCVLQPKTFDGLLELMAEDFMLVE